MIKVKDNLGMYFITQLSEHRYKDQNGYLICENATLGRTGIQRYLDYELGLGRTGKVIDVYRDEDDVFDNDSLSSLESRPITINHPKEDVTSLNNSKLAKGFVKNVWRDNDLIMGNLVFQDEDAIELIESGKMNELSLGYSADISYDSEIDKYKQTNILYNHLALVKKGRAGVAKIIDEDTIGKENIVDTEKTEVVTDAEEAKEEKTIEAKKEEPVVEKEKEVEKVKEEEKVDYTKEELDKRFEEIISQMTKLQGSIEKLTIAKAEVKDEEVQKEESALKLKDTENNNLVYDAERHEKKLIREFRNLNPNRYASKQEYDDYLNKLCKGSLVDDAYDNYLEEGDK